MKYVVLGASAAGMNGLSVLRSIDEDAEILLISEDEAVYSRCILHHYMEGIRDLKQLNFVPHNFFEDNRIDWIKGVKVVGLDIHEKQVILNNGDKVSYDKLLIATGAHPFMPPIKGLREAKNAVGFRTFDDCLKILDYAKDIQNIVVMGGGLVGIDAVTGLLHKGKTLSIVEMKDRMLSMQLDKRAASTYEKAYEEQGVKQYYGVGVSDLVTDEDGLITEVILTDGKRIPCELLIVTAGVRANVEFLKDSGVETDRFGLIIDDHGRTNVPDIYGAGDVTGRNPIWSVAVKEGIIAASNMAGQERVMNDFFASKSTMNFLGIPSLSLGINTPEDDSYEVAIEDDGVNYKKIIHKDGLICGAVIQGNLSYAGILTQMIRRKINISNVKKPIFKIDYSDFFHQNRSYQYTFGEEE